MKAVIEVTHDEAGGMRPMYIYYSREPVAKTVNCDDEGSVCVDFDANGGVGWNGDPSRRRRRNRDRNRNGEEIRTEPIRGFRPWANRVVEAS